MTRMTCSMFQAGCWELKNDSFSKYAHIGNISLPLLNESMKQLEAIIAAF